MIPLKRHLEKSDSGTQKADGSRNSKQLLNEYEALLEIVYELGTTKPYTYKYSGY